MVFEFAEFNETVTNNCHAKCLTPPAVWLAGFDVADAAQNASTFQRFDNKVTLEVCIWMDLVSDLPVTPADSDWAGVINGSSHP